MLENLKITEYELLYDKKSLRSVVLQLRRGRGCERWLISRAGDCLGKTPNAHGYFTFEYEPLPSSRDDDYYREHRFDSAEKAYQFWIENRNKILATQREWIEFVRMTRGISHI
jgi:hypothetical protein